MLGISISISCSFIPWLFLSACPKVGQRRNRNWWGLKTQLSNLKSGIWLLHRATTHTSPLSPDGTSETPRNTKSFSSSPAGWSVQEETLQWSEIFSLHPVLIPSVWIAKDCLVWVLNWKDAASLPSHTPDPSLYWLAIIKKQIHNYIFFNLLIL